MRGKVQCNFLSCCISKLFLNFRCVAVGCYCVSLYIFIDLTEQIIQLRPSSRTGGSGFCINNQGISINNPFLYQWITGENTASRIAPRICYQSCLSDFAPCLFHTDHTPPRAETEVIYALIHTILHIQIHL